jgi:hypothetical protein
MSPVSEHLFIEHPYDQPLSLRSIKTAVKNFNTRYYRRIDGGIRLITRQSFEPGTLIEIQTRIRGEGATFRGRVLWIKEIEGRTSQLGLVFDNSEEAYRARMIEQLCHIEHYQRRQYAAGRNLDVHDAANEWIEQYSPNFPQIGASIPGA